MHGGIIGVDWEGDLKGSGSCLIDVRNRYLPRETWDNLCVSRDSKWVCGQ